MSDTILLAPRLAEITRLAAWSEAFADSIALPAASRFALQLCLEEQVSNAVRHGGATAPIRVTLAASADRLTATVEDEGLAFDPLAAEARPPAATIEDAAVGGLGLTLMRSFAAAAQYERLEGVNRLILSFART